MQLKDYLKVILEWYLIINCFLLSETKGSKLVEENNIFKMNPQRETIGEKV